MFCVLCKRIDIGVLVTTYMPTPTYIVLVIQFTYYAFCKLPTTYLIYDIEN